MISIPIVELVNVLSRIVVFCASLFNEIPMVALLKVLLAMNALVVLLREMSVVTAPARPNELLVIRMFSSCK